jgi:predicted Zn-dependent protease
MRAWLVVASLLGVACGGGERPPPKPTAVIVPTAAEPDEPERTAEGAGPTRAGPASSIEACARELRRALDLQVEPEERSLYDQAFAQEDRGELSDARKSYFLLIQNHPRSRLIPLAYLAFGELFAKDSASDPSKWDLARASYGEVLKYPPPDNVSFAYASLRFADTRREQDPQEALGQYKKALEATARYPSLPCSDAVRQGAEQGLLGSYVQVGQPEKAWAFLRATAGEGRARALLSELAARYRTAGKVAEACAAARGAGAEGADLARSVCP